LKRRKQNSRQRAAKSTGSGESFPTPKKKREKRTRDKVAEYAGVSGKTLEKIEKVVEAAEKKPEKYGSDFS